MNKILLPLIAATIAVAASAPAFAQDAVVAPVTASSNVVALGNRELAVVDTAGTKIATLVPQSNATYRLRIIGATTAAPAANVPFKLNFTGALSPMQMNAVYDREIDRVFNVTHSN
jgi:hypothetical protein